MAQTRSLGDARCASSIENKRFILGGVDLWGWRFWSSRFNDIIEHEMTGFMAICLGNLPQNRA